MCCPATVSRMRQALAPRCCNRWAVVRTSESVGGGVEEADGRTSPPTLLMPTFEGTGGQVQLLLVDGHNLLRGVTFGFPAFAPK